MKGTEFTKDHFEAIYPLGIENHYWTHARNLIIEDALKVNKLKGEKILEIGSGRGVVVKFLRERGFDCYGVELSNADSETNKLPFIDYGISFEVLDKDFRDSIKVVLLFDVLEHIEDDVDFLKKIKDKFPQLQTLIMTIPARQELWSNYDTFMQHFRRYDLKSLNDSLSKASFVGRNRYFFHSLYLPAKMVLTFQKNRKTIIQAPKGATILSHRITAWLFYIEYKFFPKKLAGTSIISLSRIKSINF